MTQIVLLEIRHGDGDITHGYLNEPELMTWYHSGNHLPIPDHVINTVRSNEDDTDYYDDGTEDAYPEDYVREEMERYVTRGNPEGVLVTASKYISSMREFHDLLTKNGWKIGEEINVSLI